ncbi:MAG: TonB-dependent receptor [Deltaproteobacteria bacterium]|nr:TonB-dependent receptor [Deltaproteobacteria bacterium]
MASPSPLHRIPSWPALCLVATAALAAAAPAAAQLAAPATADIEAVSLASLVDLPLEAVSLHEERLSEAAATAFVLTGDDLRQQGFRTLHEALRSVPGLFGYRDDSFPMIGVRGVGLPSDYSTRLLVLVNGHALNDSIGLGGTRLGRDLPIPLDAVKRIEVIKGPVGSLYGPTAFLGLVNLVTVDADDQASQVRVGAEASQGQVRGAEVSAVLTARAGEARVVAAVQGHRAGGADYRLPELTLPLAGRAPAAGPLASGLDGNASGSAYARLEWKGVSLAGACSAWSSGLVTAAYGSSIGDDRTRAATRNCFVEAAHARRLDDRLSIALRASWDTAAYRDVYAYPPPPEGYGLFRDASWDRWGSLEARATWRPREGSLVVAGVSGQWHRTVQRTWADGLPTVREDPVNGVGSGDVPRDYGTVDGYLLLDQALARGLRMHLGATVTWHELFGSRLTSKAALVWSPTSRDVLKAVFAQGFRPPAASEAFYDDQYSYLANPALRPEVVDAFELAYRRALGPHAALTASLFAHHYTSLIRYETVAAPGVISPDPANPLDFRQQARNAGALWLRGAELTASVRWGRWLSLYGGLGLQEIDAGGRVNFPSATANLAASSRALWEPLVLSANLGAVSRRGLDPANLPADGATSTGPQVLVNAAALLEIPGSRASLELRVANLLGEAAPDPLIRDFAPVTSMPQRPRTLGLAFRYDLD